MIFNIGEMAARIFSTKANSSMLLINSIEDFGGADETRTRDPVRDRHVF